MQLTIYVMSAGCDSDCGKTNAAKINHTNVNDNTKLAVIVVIAVRLYIYGVKDISYDSVYIYVQAEI